MAALAVCAAFDATMTVIGEGERRLVRLLRPLLFQSPRAGRRRRRRSRRPSSSVRLRAGRARRRRRGRSAFAAITVMSARGRRLARPPCTSRLRAPAHGSTRASRRANFGCRSSAEPARLRKISGTRPADQHRAARASLDAARVRGDARRRTAQEPVALRTLGGHRVLLEFQRAP